MIEMNYVFGTKVLVTEETIKYHGSFENGSAFGMDILEMVAKELMKHEKPVLIDVGACTGSYALLDTVVPNCQIYSFEPSRTFKELEKNIKLNNSKTVAVNEAVSNYVGDSLFNEVKTDRCIALSMLGGNPASHKDVEQVIVSVTSIDDKYWWWMPTPNVIKIDTEGNELFVLEGAIETIKQSRPVIFSEYTSQNTHQYGYERERIKEFLEELGYRVEMIGGADIVAYP
jgi:FkbM family methyltransferase